MTPEEFIQDLLLGHEVPGVEFKGAGSRKGPLFAKTVRAAIAMANRRSGGRIIIGVGEDDAGHLIQEGLSDQDLQTWSHEDVAGAINAYAEPYLNCSVEPIVYLEKNYVVITVDEFGDTPVLCTKDFQDAQEKAKPRPPILRAGACYVRRRGRIESSEIPNYAEMRELLDLATEKALRRFLRTASHAGLPITQPEAGDAERFQEELKDFE